MQCIYNGSAVFDWDANNLRKIRALGYELVMVSNQDGLGTKAFPESDFLPAHTKMLKTLGGEGITFAAIHIDRSLPADKAPTRKPGTGIRSRGSDQQRGNERQ